MSKDTRQLLREVVERCGISWDAVSARVHADNAGMELRDAEWLVKSLREDKAAPVVVADAIVSLLIGAYEDERADHKATIKHCDEELRRQGEHP